MKTQRTTNQPVQQLFILCLFAYVSVFHYNQLILFMAITILGLGLGLGCAMFLPQIVLPNNSIFN